MRIYTIIFESDTDAGRRFDVLLILTIIASVVVVILDSVQSITADYDTLFDVLEWGFTLLFTVEYVLRLLCVQHPLRYAMSFFGIVDLLAVLPTYFAFFLSGPPRSLVHDAARMGHPRRPHRHRHGGDDRPSHAAAGHDARVP